MGARAPYRKYVIVRPLDGRAMMEGTNACEFRWGYDPPRAYRFTREELDQCQLTAGVAIEEGEGYPMSFLEWRYRVLPTCAVLAYFAWGL